MGLHVFDEINTSKGKVVINHFVSTTNCLNLAFNYNIWD